MNVLSLFSGIGGIELGLERAGMTVVGQVEIDPFCRKILAKHWPGVPQHDDVRTAAGWWLSESRPRLDAICGGFPCQDISNAGKRVGIEGERSGLWFAMADVVRVLRPRYVVMENVSAIVNRGLDVVLGTLAEIGYDCEWDCIPASSVGAPHRRDRWWGIAYPHADGQRPQVEPERDRAAVGPGLEASQRNDADRLRDAVPHAPRSGRSDESFRSHGSALTLGALAGAGSGATSGDLAPRDREPGRSPDVMASPVADAAGDRFNTAGRLTDRLPWHFSVGGESSAAPISDSSSIGLERRSQPDGNYPPPSRGGNGQPGRVRHGDGSTHLAHADGPAGGSARSAGEALLGPETVERPGRRGGSLGSHWAAEPDVGRVANGVPSRVDRLKALGNAVVPQVAEHVGRCLMASDEVH